MSSPMRRFLLHSHTYELVDGMRKGATCIGVWLGLAGILAICIDLAFATLNYILYKRYMREQMHVIL